jgi:DNA polymerase III delta subunit
MLARQIRLLIQAKDGGAIAGPPFMVTKLKQQASGFSLAQLLTLHNQLVEIDYGIKTSTDAMTVRQQLDLLLLRL